MLWPVRALRRAALRFKINDAAYEARLCMRDMQAARANYDATLNRLELLHARLADLDQTQPPSRLEPMPPARDVPSLLVRRS